MRIKPFYNRKKMKQKENEQDTIITNFITHYTVMILEIPMTNQEKFKYLTEILYGNLQRTPPQTSGGFVSVSSTSNNAKTPGDRRHFQFLPITQRPSE